MSILAMRVAIFSILMIVLRYDMRANIALTVAYVFGVFFLLWRGSRKTNESKTKEKLLENS